MPIGSISQALKLTYGGFDIDNSLTYHFATALPAYLAGYNTQRYDGTGALYSLSAGEFQSFTTLAPLAEVSATRSFTGFASAAAITFSAAATDAADIVFSGITKQIYTGTGGLIAGFALPPMVTGPERYDVVIAPFAANNTWINVIVQHELGHSVGLRDVQGAGAPIYSGDEDNGRYTMMSYNPHQGILRPVQELQLYDIAAVQAIYGRNDGFNAGDTPIMGFTEPLGPYAGADRAFAIWDGGGVDKINASGLGQAALIDLRPGYFSSIGNLTGVSVSAGINPTLNNAGELNISIAYGAYIENATGTSQADLLIGNILSNALEGGSGDDVIYAEGANAIHDAGDGSYDRVTVGGAEGPTFSVRMLIANPDLQRDVLSGDEGNDSLYGGRGKDTLSGGTGTDYLRGGSGNDTLAGDEGDDFFYAEEGDDEIWGGGNEFDLGTADGNDTIDYESSSNPITITFDGTAESATITVNDGMGGTDTLKSIEKIIGTAKYDQIQINGEIPTDTELTIDANGGQAPNAFGSILNGSTSTKKIELDIDATGNGYIRSVGGGEITLEGFHTQAIGSNLDDSLSDDSDGKKRLDGGEGNDVISTAASSGDATMYGGAGDDTITGGAGNDVIYGDDSFPWEYNYNTLNGGAGSDLIVSMSAYDVVDGGADDDYIKLGFAPGAFTVMWASDLTVDGGEGDDYIEVAGYVSTVNVTLSSDGGQDAVVTPPSDWFNSAMTGAGINIVMDGLSYSDFTIIVDATPTGNSFQGWADIAVVRNDTGASVYLPAQYLHANDQGGSTAFSIISFNGEQLNPNHHVVFGSVSGYVTDLSGFNSAAEPSAEDTTGTSGDDHLAGGHGDDTLTGGDGNDAFEASGGNDSIDGGAGEDTLNVFGARSRFSITGNSSSMTLTDLTGREGTMVVAGVERVFFVSSGETYALGDFFGYYGTSGDDVITATDRNNQIYGLAGNDTLNGMGGNDTIEGGAGDDTINGGTGNDTARYAGSSSDYVVTRLSGGGATVVAIGVGITDGTDVLQDVETVRFVGNNVQIQLDTLPIIGSSGDDIIVGGEEGDDLYGEDGSDILQGGGGNDLLDGGSGDDLAYYSGPSTDFAVYFDTDGTLYVSDRSDEGVEGFDELVDIEEVYFAGDNTTIQVGDLPPLGTSSNDVIAGSNRHDVLYGLDGDDTLTGAGGNDDLDGGSGADIMSGGAGNDYYSVDDVGDVVTENADEGYDTVSSSITYTLGAHVEGLSLWSDAATDGTGNALNNEIYGDDFENVLSGLDGDDLLDGGGGNDTLHGGNGLDTASYWNMSTDYEAFREMDGSVTVYDPNDIEGEDTLTGIEKLYFWGDDITIDVADLPLRGTASNDTLSGGSGNDAIFGLDGNDRLTGGAGNDVLDGGTGASDVAVFAGTQASHTIATNGGVVTITDNQPSTDGDDGVDTVIGIEIAEFKGGAQTGITSPIVLDLNGNGVTLVNNRETRVAFDWDGDGSRNQTGWVGRDDGFLVFDRDGNGAISNGGELSFTGDKPGAKSDLDGLRAFDSDGDGQFSSDDEQFGSFRIWRDANGNGRSDRGEMSTLEEAGIASINLAGEAVNRTWAWGDNMTINNGSYTRTDGSTGAFGDVALNYDVTTRRGVAPFLLRERVPHRAVDALQVNRAAMLLGEAMAGFIDNRGLGELRFDEAMIAPQELFLPAMRHM